MKILYASNDKINMIKVSHAHEQLLTLKQQQDQLQHSTMNYQLNEILVKDSKTPVEEMCDEITREPKQFEGQRISEIDIEKQFSKIKTSSTNYKYLTFSSSASKTFDKSLRNLFKYIRLYNNNETNLK